MIEAGQTVLFRFPRSDLAAGKLRPALVVARVPGPYEDWLICMISSQLQHRVPGFDELIQQDDPDFQASGMKRPSLVRLGRIAIVEARALLGTIGRVDGVRLRRIRKTLSEWLRVAETA